MGEVDSQQKAQSVAWVPYIWRLWIGHGLFPAQSMDHLLCVDELRSYGGSSPSFDKLFGAGSVTLEGESVPRFKLLRKVDSLVIYVSRSDLKGLEMIEEVSSFLLIGSPTIISLEGLESLRRVGRLTLRAENLTSTEALSGLTEIEGFLITEHIPVASLGGLRNVRKIQDRMKISTRFGAQEDLHVFERLEEIGGDVSLIAEWEFRCETFHFFRQKKIGGELRVNGWTYDPEECPEP